MSGHMGLSLNLASKPARNRRFFLWARSCFAAVMAGAFLVGAWSGWRYAAGIKHRREAAADAESLAREAQNEEERLDAEIRNAERAGRIKVDTLNSIIYQKSFSWTDFFSLLEVSLPDASYLTALSPGYSGDRTILLRITVVSRNLDDLVALINNLTARDFKNIRVENEAKNERGQLVSELSMTYERVI